MEDGNKSGVDAPSKITKVFVAGHNGLVGSAIVRLLEEDQQYELVVSDRKDLDLTRTESVNEFFKSQRVDQVYLAAARVGGIYANKTFPASFIYENLMIQTNVISAAKNAGVNRLLFLGSSCIYPRDSRQPIQEQFLMTGELEMTNKAYAIAKIAGIEMCSAYIEQYGFDCRSLMPTNLYGPGDNYHPQNSHVIPALVRRFHYAKVNGEREVAVWGSGRPKREFLFVDDFATACKFVMELSKSDYEKVLDSNITYLNVGSGVECTISHLAYLVAEIVGYEGDVKFNTDMPDGTFRKLLDSHRIFELGWRPQTSLKAGLVKTYAEFLKTLPNSQIT